MPSGPISRARYSSDPGTVMVEELGLCRGLVRVDLAVVNGLLHGFEIKSDRDHLRRLSTQVEIYGRVLERATLVVGPRHLFDAAAMVPEWWGVLRYEGTESLRFRVVRRGRKNPARDPRSLVELLWLDEALAVLVARGMARGARRKPRSIVWDKICEHLGADEIAAMVCDALRSRAATRALAQPS